MERMLVEPSVEANALSNRVIGAAIEVHRVLGPGLLESMYESALCIELELQGIAFQRQVQLPVMYKGHTIEAVYRVDLVIDSQIVLEIKAVDRLVEIHDAQLLTYMRLLRLPLGIIINFNVPLLRDGIRRKVLTST